jgi:hypothetical protein
MCFTPGVFGKLLELVPGPSSSGIAADDGEIAHLPLRERHNEVGPGE